LPIENVVIQITGANPQTKSIQVNVNPTTGAGSASLTLSGVNSGTDVIKATATIAGTSYTSNSAEIGWQATNGPIATGAITASFWPSVNGSNGAFGQYHPMPAPSSVNTQGNSLLFNLQGGLGGDPNTQPMVWTIVSSSGVPTSSVTAWSGATAGYDMAVTGSFVVAQAGTTTFTAWHDDGMIWGLGGGATRVSGNGLVDGWNHTETALNGLPLIGGNNNSGFWTETFGVNFPTPGIYPFEFDYSNWQNEQTLQIVSGGGYIKTVQIGTNPTAPAGTGNLTITPAAQGLFVVGTSTTITINVQGIVYSTKPYVPIYEGVAGSLLLYNSGTSFVFPEYNGKPVSLTAAASAGIVNLSGSNNSYQGLVSVQASSTYFQVTYNGGALVPNVPYTTLTVTVDDVAWYNSVSQSFDIYTPSANGGSIAYQIEYDYMVKPVVASLSPLSVPADGGSHVFAVSLVKPISPQQQGVNNTGNTFAATFSIQGTTGLTATAVLNSSGWITGYNITAKAPVSSTNIVAAASSAFSGTLTHLSGTSFVASNPYPGTTAMSSVTFVGQAYSAPVSYAFNVTPVTGTAPNFILTPPTTTLSATVYTTINTPITLAFYREQEGTTTVVNLGTGVAGATSTGTISGKTVYFTTFTLSIATSGITVVSYLGYKATATAGGLTTTYWSSSLYSGEETGGSGCPSIDMFVTDSVQVWDVGVGFELTCLAQGPTEYISMDKVPDSEKILSGVEWRASSVEICYRLITENGAEVTVSDSTPIPVREFLSEAVEKKVIDLKVTPKDILPGMHLLTDVGDGLGWSRLVSVECVGEKPVARLYCGGKNFASGAIPGKYIYTHNTQPIPPPGGGGGK
jgi:hypothetical protein